MRTAFARRGLILLLGAALVSILVLHPAGLDIWADLGVAPIVVAGLIILPVSVPGQLQLRPQPLSFFSPNPSRGPPAA